MDEVVAGMPTLSSQAAQVSDPRSLPTVRLEVQQGSRSTAFEMTEVGFLIGSVPGCDLRVPGVDLPAVLAMISRQPEGVELRKLAPMQPIQLNGRSATRTLLKPGDRITFGNIAITLSITPATATSPPVPVPVEATSPSAAQLKAARDELQQQLVSFREQVVRFERERHNEEQKLQARHESLENLAQDLRQRERAQAGQTRQPQPDLSGVHANLAQREQALAHQIADLEQREQAVAAQTTQFENQKQEINSLRQELADIRGQLYERYRERRDRLSGLQEAVNHAARKVQEQKRQLEADLRSYADTRAEDAAQHQELAAKTVELTNLAHRVDREQQRLEAQRVELQQREEALQAQLTQVDEKKQQYQDDIVLLSRLQLAFEQKEADFQKRSTEFEQRMDRLRLDSRDMEEQVHQIEQWRQRLGEEERRLAEQKAEQESIGSQLIQRAAALEGQQTTLTTLRSRLERMRDEVRQEEQQLAEMRARQEATEQELQQQAQDLQRARGELTGEQQLRLQEREQLAERSATLEAAVAQLRQAQEQFTHEEGQLAARHAEIDARAAQLDAQTQQLREQQIQIEDAQLKLEAERQTVRERTLALAQAEQVRESLQEQLRRRSEELAVRQQDFGGQIAHLDEQARALEQQRADVEQQCQQRQDELAQVQQLLDAQNAALDGKQAELQAREETLERHIAKLKLAGQRIAGERKALAEERLQRQAALTEEERKQAEVSNEFQTVITKARELLQHLPDLELRAGAALERLTHVREQMREHLAEFHNYTRRSQDDLEELHARIQSDAARIKQQEQGLRRLQDENRLEVAAFRQQLIDWQGQLTEKKRSLENDETRLERTKAQVIEQARQVDATSQTLARQAQELQVAERQVHDRRQEVDRHLADMRRWYRKKLRELAGIEEAPARSALAAAQLEALASSAEPEPAGTPKILTFPGAADEADQKLGELLRTLELIDADTLGALLAEARRQRRSLRQILLASGTVTLYQMAIIEAGQVDALMLGPVRVIDRLRMTNRETLFRVFDPRRGQEAVLRHLSEDEMHDAVRPDEFRERFRQACLAHPHLAATLEVVEIGGRPAALQEWVVGLPCPDWPPLAAVPGVCLRLVKQAAMGLLAVHEAGLVHGHLRDNLLFLTPEGNLKICGLGEPPWLSGISDETTDPAADLQALGRIATEWSVAGVRRGARSKPLPDELLAVLGRLAGTAGPGYADAAALLADLERIHAKIPANNEAWDRLLKHIQEHAMPELVLRQSA